MKKLVNPKAATDKPVAAISQMGEVEKFSNDKLEDLRIVHSGMTNLKILNMFRELRTQLLQRNSKNNFVCMVTSLCSGGGASYVATNLAAVFSLDKAKTSVVIDANLYAPSLGQLVIGEVDRGITDYLSDPTTDIKDIVYATGIPRLRVIPIGGNREAAAEYFSSEKMQHFVDELRSRYTDRYIFIDAPPVTEASETRILAEIADLVVLVVPHGKVTPSLIDSAIDIVGNDRLSGLVYNN